MKKIKKIIRDIKNKISRKKVFDYTHNMLNNSSEEEIIKNVKKD